MIELQYHFAYINIESLLGNSGTYFYSIRMQGVVVGVRRINTTMDGRKTRNRHREGATKNPIGGRSSKKKHKKGVGKDNRGEKKPVSTYLSLHQR